MLGVAALFIAATVLVDGMAQDKSKYTIKDVMKKAHKEGLLKTVLGGGASMADRESLAEMYTALGQNKPPKGDAASWKEKTDALAKDAKALVKDGKDKDAISGLKKSSNCMGCHSAHKG
jgi:hypothetical protein